MADDVKPIGSEVTKDFDLVVPPKRIAKIAGEVVDVSVIPARAILAINQRMQDRAKRRESFSLEDTLEIVALACQPSNPKVTKKWLEDHVEDGTKLLEFVDYVMEPILAYYEKRKNRDQVLPL